MRKEYVAFIALFGILSCLLHADAQDIIFPGEIERPQRFPLNPESRPQNPNNNNGQGRNPNNNNNGQGQQPNNPNGGISQEQYNTCIGGCLFTSEYNPVCGSDGVTYQNIGSMNCAVKCGNPIQNLGRAPCATTTPTPVATPTNRRV